jgi:hypothetical protein
MKRVLVLLLLTAACGGGGDDGAGEKQAYVAKAEAICTTGNEQLAALKKTPPAGVDQVPAYVHKIVEVARTNVTQLTALTPPKDDTLALNDKFLRPLQEQLRDAEAYDKKVAAASGTDLFALITNPPTQTRVDLAFLRNYGFSQCVTAADTANATK